MKIGVWCFIVALLLIFANPSKVMGRSAPIVIDHNSYKQFDQIGEASISQIKNKLFVSFNHTSHGSQIFSGMKSLMNLSSSYNYCDDAYYYLFANNSHMCNNGGLSMWDGEGTDLGNPNTTAWRERTEEIVANRNNKYQIFPNKRNVIMWSWCGQLSTMSSAQLQRDYLDNMAQLEALYPNITFVYMTGHLDGSGTAGNLHQRNEQIRNFVRSRNGVLFDFADIESYDPDGINYLNQGGSDELNYNNGNWGDQWCSRNPNSPYCRWCSNCGECAHSRTINCNLKARAYWVMLAKLAGEGGITQVQASPTTVVRNGDANNDGYVDGLDYIIWLNNYTDSEDPDREGGRSIGDFNLNKRVDGLDYLVWLNTYRGRS